MLSCGCFYFLSFDCATEVASTFSSAALQCTMLSSCCTCPRACFCCSICDKAVAVVCRHRQQQACWNDRDGVLRKISTWKLLAAFGALASALALGSKNARNRFSCVQFFWRKRQLGYESGLRFSFVTSAQFFFFIGRKNRVIIPACASLAPTSAERLTHWMLSHCCLLFIVYALLI